jgi:hypothetical protein
MPLLQPLRIDHSTLWKLAIVKAGDCVSFSLERCPNKALMVVGGGINHVPNHLSA